MIEAIAKGVDEGVIDDLAKTPKDYCGGAYNFVTDINNVAVKPVVAILLSIVFTMELARVSTKVDGDRTLGVKMVAASMFKMALILTASANSQLFLDAIFQIFNKVLVNLNKYIRDHGDLPPGGDDWSKAAKNSIGNWDYLGQAACLVILLIPFLCAMAAQVAFKLMLILRFFEIFMYSAFAALPVAFLASDDMRSMAIGFWRKYGSACVKNVTLIMGVYLYRVLLRTGSFYIKPPASKDSFVGWCFHNFAGLILLPVLFIGILGVSNSIAKALCGE